MSEPVPPPVPLPGGVVLGPDGSVSFPGQAQQDQVPAGGPAPIVPGVPEPVPAAAPPPTVGSGQFTVDLERAPQALRELEKAKHQLETLRDDVSRLGRVEPPGQDSVSVEVAQVLSATAVVGPGSAVTALQAGIVEMGSLISKIRRELSNYSENESDAKEAFRADRS